MRRVTSPQLQGETPTVQLALNNALSTLLRTPIETYGASRTDEGVHALSNYYHFDVATEITFDLLYKMNAILSSGVAAKRLLLVADDFNVRFAAKSRLYRYRICNLRNPFLVDKVYFFPLKLDEELLHSTAAIIPEYTTFSSFCKRRSQSKTHECKILQSRWERNGEELHYIVEGNRFLRGMVRGLVGTQLQVARGKMSLADFRQVIEAQDCTKAFFDVPGHGLYLERLEYGEGVF